MSAAGGETLIEKGGIPGLLVGGKHLDVSLQDTFYSEKSERELGFSPT
jgi:hypothetical protein